MYHVKLRKTKRARRKLSVRKAITGSFTKPRLTIFRSNKYIYAQIIDDVTRKTLVSVDNETKKMHEKTKKADAAFELGKALAVKALENKVKEVVFDRNGYRYHGRVKRLAEGAREGGLLL
jgi:large subunit ribosomal protein L18